MSRCYLDADSAGLQRHWPMPMRYEHLEKQLIWYRFGHSCGDDAIINLTGLQPSWFGGRDAGRLSAGMTRSDRIASSHECIQRWRFPPCRNLASRCMERACYRRGTSGDPRPGRWGVSA